MIDRRSTRAAAAAAAVLLPAAFTPARAQLAETRYRHMQLGTGTFLLQSSQLALTQSQNAFVRTFATFEIAEQQSVLAAMVAAGHPTPATVLLEAPMASMLETLRGLSGPAFDARYVAAQITAHQEALQLNQAEAATGTDRDDKIIATLATATIRQHLAMLQAMQLPG